MRVDKFLKVSRVIKRRTLAKEISSEGRIKINDNTAKAGSEVSAGDVLEIKFGQKIVTLEILQLEAHTKKEDAERMYKVVKEEKIN